jgi:predicted DCC family thiol-disulfide oxidoreductase YuxK
MQLLQTHGLAGSRIETNVFIEDTRAWLRSEAALRIARQLTWPWPALYAAIIIPRPIRDAVYGFIAWRRYRWFGRAKDCAWVAPERRSRFP